MSIRALIHHADSLRSTETTSARQGLRVDSGETTARCLRGIGMLLLIVVLTIHSRTASAATWADNVGCTVPFNQGNSLDIADYCNGNDQIDDTADIQAWLNDAQSLGKHLWVSPGTYIHSTRFFLWSGSQMKGADPNTCVFKYVHNASSPGHCFMHTSDPDWGSPYPEPYNQIRYENIGFDWNGYNQPNFTGPLLIIGQNAPTTRITIRNIRVFDSFLQSQGIPMFTGRDEQRQYVTVGNGQDVLIEDCNFTHGGRIKASEPIVRCVIRNNTLTNINDNAITIADFLPSPSVSEDVIISGNTVTNPLGSGIFAGADGERAGWIGKTFRRILITNNTVVGDFFSAGITTQACDIFEDIHVHDNYVLKNGFARDPGDPSSPVSGLRLADSNNLSPGSSAKRITWQDNYVECLQAGQLDEAIRFRAITDNSCNTVGNTFDVKSSSNTAVYMYFGYNGAFFGNVVNGGIRIDSQPPPLQNNPDQDGDHLPSFGAVAGSSSAGNPGLVNDGDDNTWWGSGDLPLTDNWVYVNLGSLKTVKVVSLKTIIGSATTYPVVIETSTDAVGWSTVRTAMTWISDGVMMYDVLSIPAQYVRVRATGANTDGDNYLRLATVAVYGSHSTTAGNLTFASTANTSQNLGQSSSNNRMHESFTLGSGYITGAQVGLSRTTTAPTANVIVSIRSSLTGANLAQATITPGQVTSTNGNSPTNITATFPTPLAVSSGTTYYLTLTTTGTNSTRYYRWSQNSGNPFAGGQFFLLSAPQSTKDVVGKIFHY